MEFEAIRISLSAVKTGSAGWAGAYYRLSGTVAEIFRGINGYSGDYTDLLSGDVYAVSNHGT